MTTNTAAPARLEAVLTDDQIETLAKKHIAPHADRLDKLLPHRVPYQQTEQFRRVKALIADVLSKLRAPVADETHALHDHDAWFQEYIRPLRAVGDPLTIIHTRAAWIAALTQYAALASAPVAGKVAPPDWADRFPEISDMGRLNEAWRAASMCAPVADERKGAICKLIDDLQERAKEAKRYDDFDDLGTLRLLAWKASAPVAGEAQLPWHVPVQHWSCEEKAKLDAAPQASEAVPELGSTVVNDACWKFIEAMPHQLPGPIFNDLKPALHAAICHVLAERQQRAALSAQPGAQKNGGSDAN